jgi:major membrane immunogen (membrane-anchored lipoprotein)
LQEQYEANAGKEFVNVGDGKMVDKAWLEYQQGMSVLQAEDAKYKEELDRQAEEMGDRIFLWNMAVLSPSNII